MQVPQENRVDTETPGRKPYHRPNLTVHGDFRGLTLSGAPVNPTSYDGGTSYVNAGPS